MHGAAGRAALVEATLNVYVGVTSLREFEVWSPLWYQVTEITLSTALQLKGVARRTSAIARVPTLSTLPPPQKAHNQILA